MWGGDLAPLHLLGFRARPDARPAPRLAVHLETRPQGRTRTGAALFLGACALAACSGLAPSCERAAPPDGALADLEHLAFVPPGECALQPRFGMRLSCANARALLVDRFEVTRDDWRAWYERTGAPRTPVFEGYASQWTPDSGDWPASFMTLEEARSYAGERGMRLPSAREWIRVACGTRALPYPWGAYEASSVANTLNLGVSRLLPVGTFEQGRTPLSTYDMLGNVWEWVDEPIVYDTTGSLRARLDEFGDSPRREPSLAWAMGGSYLSRLRRLHDLDGAGGLSLHVLDLDPASRSIDVGLRCCADAEEYLWSRSPRWSDPRDRERLLAVGAVFGRDAIPLLDALAGRAGAPAGLGWLLEGARR